MSMRGLFDDIPMADYLADEWHGGPPTLSHSLIHLICTRSPWHAWHHHPRLNPEHERVDDSKFDLGTAAHRFILENARDFVIIDAADWRTADAKTKRDAARLAGKTPLLRAQWEQVGRMAESLGPQFAAVEPPQPFAVPGGKPEQTLIWKEGDVLCRARLDWLHDSHRVVDDLKTVGGSAHPEAFSRSIWSFGYDLQAALYLRGIRTVLGVDAIFRFVAVEVDAPHAASVITLAPDALELANRKVDHALAIWRHALEHNVWPGYPAETAHVEAPAWELAKWERALHQPTGFVDSGGDIAELL